MLGSHSVKQLLHNPQDLVLTPSTKVKAECDSTHCHLTAWEWKMGRPLGFTSHLLQAPKLLSYPPDPNYHRSRRDIFRTFQVIYHQKLSGPSCLWNLITKVEHGSLKATPWAEAFLRDHLFPPVAIVTRDLKFTLGCLYFPRQCWSKNSMQRHLNCQLPYGSAVSAGFGELLEHRVCSSEWLIFIICFLGAYYLCFLQCFSLSSSQERT